MKIGVIGGNGVAATNRLCEMIERKKTAGGAFRDAHHPEMIVWYATQAPSRSMFLEGRGEDWRPEYIRIAKTLRDLGCDAACMCCNTAHYAIGDVSEASGLPFINLLEIVARRAKKLGHERYELWVTDGARKFDIYGRVFSRICPEINLVYPSVDRQRVVTEIICSVKTSDRFSGKSRELLNELAAKSECPVILGCTDLRVAYAIDDRLAPTVAIDSLETLADEIVELTHA